MAFFLQRPTWKPNQQNSTRPLEGNYFEGTFGGVAWRAQARYFFNQKKKKKKSFWAQWKKEDFVYPVTGIYVGYLTKRWAPQCVGLASLWGTRHICWVQDIPPQKRKHVGLENIPFYDILMCKSRSERMVHCYYFTPFLGLHGWLAFSVITIAHLPSGEM